MNSNNILKKYFPKHLRNNLPFSKEDCLLSLNRITKDLSCDWIDSFSDRILGKIKQVQSSDIICFQDILYIGIMLEKIKSEINDSEYRKIVKKLESHYPFNIKDKYDQILDDYAEIELFYLLVENGWSNIKIEPETGVIKNNQSYRAEAYIKKLNLFFETKNFCYLRTKEAKAMSEFIEKLFSKEGNKGLYYEISPDFKVKVKQGPAKEGAMASCAINTKRLIDKMKRKMRDCDKKFKENQKVVLFFKLSDLTIQQIVMETYSRFINKSSSIIGIIIIRKINWGVGDPLKNHNVYIISKNKETEKILRKTFNKAVSH